MSIVDLSEPLVSTWGTAAREPEEVLLEAFLRQSRLTRSPVLAGDGRSILISNRAASRKLHLVDQVLLLEVALDLGRDASALPPTVMLSDGTEAALTSTRVNAADGSNVGVVAVIRHIPCRGPIGDHYCSDANRPLAELPGRAPRWRMMTERIEAAGRATILLYGERGTGKLTIARTLLGADAVTVLDAGIILSEGRSAWLTALRRYVDGPRGSLILSHIEHLDTELVRTGTRILSPARRSGARIVATASVERGDPVPHTLGDRVDIHVEVPALRDRIEDLPELLRHMTRQRRHPEKIVPSWMVDSIQALRRLDWPGNLRQLDSVVCDVLRRTSFPYIGKMDLPAELLAETSQLHGTAMGKIEARALTRALKEAGGNKLAAANALGIARSTLYRRMRAHGIDG